MKNAIILFLTIALFPFSSQAQIQLEIDGKIKITGADSITTGVFLVVDQGGIVGYLPVSSI